MSAPIPEKSRLARYRIACVDDEPTMLLALQRVLTSETRDIVTFEDPIAALEQLVKEELAVVVSDNLMPSMTGLELLAKLKATNPLCRRVLLTGATDANQAIEAFNAGIIHGFLNKPWKKEQLVELVDKEIEAYKTDRAALLERTRLEEVSKSRGTRLVQALGELKSARTELSLIEERGILPVLDASSRLLKLAILVVEENERVRELLVAELRRLGIAKTDGAESAAAAVEHFRQARPYDVVLSEWTLRDMDGLKLFRELRQSGGASAKAQFLLMAGIEQKSLVEIALNAGIDGYLIKPFRIATLLHQLERMRSWGDSLATLAADDLRDVRFLVANSQPASRHQIQQMLESAGIREVLGATFGPAALQWLQQKRPQVVICDMNMENPGWQELQRLVTACSWKPAFVLTAIFATDRDWQEAKGAKVAAFLPGPFRQRDLIEAVLAAQKANA